MEVIEILAFIFLISIVFGVSMHDALWGIIAFVVNSIVAAIFFAIGKVWFKNKIKYSKSPEGKAYKEAKRQAQKRSFIDELCGGLVLLWLFSPLLAVGLLGAASAQNPEFVKISGPITALVLVGLYAVPIVVLTRCRKQIKKRTNHKG